MSALNCRVQNMIYWLDLVETMQFCHCGEKVYILYIYIYIYIKKKVMIIAAYYRYL